MPKHQKTPSEHPKKEIKTLFPSRNCNYCKKAFCSLKTALKKGWIVGAARSFKTAEEVIEECGLVCTFYLK